MLAINADRTTRARIKNLGLTIDREMVLDELDLTITRFKVKKGATARSSLRRLRQLKTTVQYDLNHYYQIAGDHECNDIRCYGTDLIGWKTDREINGRNIKIGMVDTLVDTHIPALSKQNITRKSFVLKGKLSPKNHGTAIAALLVGASDSHFPGLLPNAALYAANVFFVDKSGRQRSTALSIAQSLDWLVSKEVTVINLSLTGHRNKLLEQAVGQTLAHNIPLVAAAGNNGPKAPPAFPAASKGVIAVTAVDRFQHSYRQANHGRYISFAAPGVSIWTPGDHGRGQLKNGTSYAAAYVTAIAVEILNHPGIEKNQNSVCAVMRKNVLDLGPSGRDDIFGWGLVRRPLNSIMVPEL